MELFKFHMTIRVPGGLLEQGHKQYLARNRCDNWVLDNRPSLDKQDEQNGAKMGIFGEKAETGSGRSKGHMSAQSGN